MPTRDEVQALLERVQNATESDFDIDHDIALAFGTSWIANPVGEVACLSYTSSIDAIVALIEKELPGWQWAAWGGAIELGSTKPRCMAHVSSGQEVFDSEAATVQVALCAAFLSAKLSQMQEEE